MSDPVQAVLQQLRPPCARSTLVTFGFAKAPKNNPGLTLQFPANEPAVAPGDGIVIGAALLFPFWNFSPGSLHASTSSYQVVIDHGQGIRTVVHGLSTIAVGQNQQVIRGQLIGAPLADEVFFTVLNLGTALNPTLVNPHFVFQDGGKVIGEGGRIKFAPDKLIRNLAGGVVQSLVNGVRYFFASRDFLVNVYFNGNGTKVGQAATGITTADYWNVYAPTAFTDTSDPSCYFNGVAGHVFNTNPAQFLYDYLQNKSTVLLEKVAPLTADAGSHVSFDAMLATYVGGYDVLHVPFTNVFNLRGLSAGTYDLYLYADSLSVTSAATDFFVSVNSGTPSHLQNAPNGAITFIQGNNYVVQNLVLSSGDVVTVKAVGFLSGLQLRRAA